MKPPWAMRWPLTMCGCTVIDITALPEPISTTAMPRPLLASSSFHIASAQARARSSGESVALTFTSNSLVVGPVETGFFYASVLGRDTRGVNALPSFRDGPKDQTRNLEILRCAIAHHSSHFVRPGK